MKIIKPIASVTPANPNPKRHDRYAEWEWLAELERQAQMRKYKAELEAKGWIINILV